MILKVNCLGCGKKGKVLILFHHIFSQKWWWFGKLRIKGLENVDYWECKECRKK